MHRLTTGLGVVLVTGAALLAIKRRRLLADVSVPLALTLAAGSAAPWAALLLAFRDRAGLAFLATVGLLALAALERPAGTRRQHAAAAAIGAALSVVAYVGWFVLFYEGN